MGLTHNNDSLEFLGRFTEDINGHIIKLANRQRCRVHAAEYKFATLEQNRN